MATTNQRVKRQIDREKTTGDNVILVNFNKIIFFLLFWWFEEKKSYISDTTSIIKSMKPENWTKRSLITDTFYWWSSLIYNTSIRHERHECDTIATRTIQVRHESKILILIMALVKMCFHTPTFTIWQLKDYMERNNFILRTILWKCLFAIPKCV